MELQDIIITSILTVYAFACLFGVRLGLIKANIAGLIMLIGPCLITAFVYQFFDEDIISTVCMGVLLSLAFGPATFVIAHHLEKKSKR